MCFQWRVTYNTLPRRERSSFKYNHLKVAKRIDASWNLSFNFQFLVELLAHGWREKVNKLQEKAGSWSSRSSVYDKGENSYNNSNKFNLYSTFYTRSTKCIRELHALRASFENRIKHAKNAMHYKLTLKYNYKEKTNMKIEYTESITAQ